MARSIILGSLFITCYAERVAQNHAVREIEAAAHESDWVPGQMLPVPRYAMPGASVAIPSARVSNGPQILMPVGLHGAVSPRVAPHRGSSWMSMQGRYDDWKSVDGDRKPGHEAWESADDDLKLGNAVWKSINMNRPDGDAAPGTNPWEIPESTRDPASDLIVGKFPDSEAEPEKPSFYRRSQLPREEWPEGQDKFYRSIRSGDPTFEEYAYNSVAGYVSKTPDKFLGRRKDGTYKGSSRVMFTLPGRDNDPELLRTIEFLKSDENDNPSFGAVEVDMPFGMTVKQQDVDSRKRLVVTNVKEVAGNFNHAAYARIKRGDIIRAVSVPEPGGTDTPWWGKVLQAEVPVAEDGMVMLDALGVSAFDAALQENARVNGGASKVVLLIERPVNLPPENDPFDWWKGLPFPAVRDDPALMKVPIPIPVEKDRDPRYPPFPGGGGRAPGGVPDGGGPRPPQGLPPFDAVETIFDQVQGDGFVMGDSSDPVARAEEEKKRKAQNEYTVNLGEAVDSLNRDIPQILLMEFDPQRTAVTNWDIYTDSLVTDFKDMVDQSVLSLVGSVAPSWAMTIEGKTANKEALQELRTFRYNFVESDEVTVKTRMSKDPRTGEEVIESRWRSKLTMKRLEIPQMFADVSRLFGRTEPVTPQSIVNVDAVSRFYLNAEGKIYKHSIDQFDLLVDGGMVNVPQLDYLLQLLQQGQQPAARPAW